MKNEIISFIIGAALVGGIWAGTTLFKGKTENSPAVAPAAAPAAPVEKPNLLKKPLSDVYSSMPEKNFAGLKLYSTDFLIPWNRTEITEYAVFNDPKGDYGSANAPMSAFMFRVEEKGKYHYFMTAGKQWGEISQLVYLGENIDVEKVEPAGNGYLLATYKDDKGRIGRGFVTTSYIVGSEPVKDTGIAQKILLNPLLKYAGK
jgi:hypothetical protein